MPHTVLAAWDLGEVRPRPSTDGLINQTFVLEGAQGPTGVLQQLNTAIFAPEVHLDIHAVTTRLVHRGLPTPVLVPTRSGALWHTDAQGGVWRVLTWVGDRTIHRLHCSAEARSAGALLARFHGALSDLDWRFRSVRPAVHETGRHMGLLQDSVKTHGSHRLFAQVAPVAEAIVAAWERLGQAEGLPRRVLHGDPKVANIRFRGAEALALIDLDTLQRGTLDNELGDALRSWCNRTTEEGPVARFDLELFSAAMQGYAAHAPWVTDAEWGAVVPSTERICWELAARFARDALEESYFGWDPQRFASRGEHNLARARGQVALAEAVGIESERAQALLSSGLMGGGWSPVGRSRP